MRVRETQKGVGLVEVLVAMILLSVGILGFVALQIRATAATTEGLKRGDAIVLMQGLAERMRLNTHGNYLLTPANKNCTATACTANDRAQDDLYTFAQQATDNAMQLATLDCPLTSSKQKRVCLVVAWDNTTPTQGADAATDCLKADGAYHPAATCMLMETY